jgi:hypothetical protein
VWHELRQAGDRVRTPELANEAQEVCDEMARRARQNVEVIVERLKEQGYRFHRNDDIRQPVEPHLEPGPNASGVADWLKSNFAVVPMTMLSWLRLVGDVWFVGTHPEWENASSADPLVIELEGSMYPADSIVDYYADELRNHDDIDAPWTDGLFRLPVAPDRLHKENTSGGPPYGFVLPDGCADALFVAETTQPFVKYLQWVFAHGGFPVRTGSREEWRIRATLAADLLPL